MTMDPATSWLVAILVTTLVVYVVLMFAKAFIR